MELKCIDFFLFFFFLNYLLTFLGQIEARVKETSGAGKE